MYKIIMFAAYFVNYEVALEIIISWLSHWVIPTTI